MKVRNLSAALLCLFLAAAAYPSAAAGWFDETHLAVAKVAGYYKWFNAAAPDVAKIKAGDREGHNHFVNNPRGAVVTPETVFAQAEKYNQPDPAGHLYGAIVASVRDYIRQKQKGRYGEYHLAYACHYIGDLSQPLHHTLYDEYNREHHLNTDGVVNDEVLGRLDRITVYPIDIRSERDLAREIARIANLSMALGYRLRDEGRLLGREEAYRQLSHSASLLKAVLEYARTEAAGDIPVPPPSR